MEKVVDKTYYILFNNSLKKDPRDQIRTIVSKVPVKVAAGLVSSTPSRKAVLNCVECLKGVSTIILGAEAIYKVLVAGSMNAMSPPRQWVLNQTFPDDWTKIWTETKAAHAYHNRAIGLSHDSIYNLPDMYESYNVSKK